MSDVPYYKPPEEGPMFPDDADGLGDEFEGFLRANDRDVEHDVTIQNIKDKTEASFQLWLAQQATRQDDTQDPK